MTSAIRLRRLIAEDEPQIVGYDEMEFSRRLHYRERPIGPSLAAMRGARGPPRSRSSSASPTPSGRATGTHTEAGAYGVEAWLRDLRGPPARPRATRRGASSRRCGAAGVG